ncbi:MAG: MBL fold metallo-hydrolase [Desulfobacterales bacterium]|nr:MBL fold metallo-hydrolase [Desulfobacterales bacterium]
MLDLIDLDIPELGYTRFISAWLYKGEEGTFVVDPGPSRTIDDLCRALRERGVDSIDFILLTHIHMDHAGGIGHLTERFPEAKVVCHEKAVSHLIDPARLWEGSVKTLGRVAEVYGEIKPVAEAQIAAGDRLAFGSGIRAIDTPGHAPHHLCFVFKNELFCGELFGVFHRLGQGFYLRPATPPRFIAEAFFASFDRIAPYIDRTIRFAHYGTHPEGRRILSHAREQLGLWIDVIREHADNPDIERIISDLEARDPVYSRINELPAGIYERERFFTRNSIDGILGYLNA